MSIPASRTCPNAFVVALAALAANGATAQPVDPPLPDWALMPAPLLAVRPPVGDTTRWVLQARAGDVQAVDATSVRELSGDWQQFAPRAGRNVAWRSARAEIAASRDGWEIAALARGEVLMSGPRSTWEAVHAYRQKATPPDGSGYALDAREDGVILAGARGAHSWLWSTASAGDLQLTAALSVLSVRRVQHVDLQGAVAYTSASGYSLAAAGERQDSARDDGDYGDKGTIGGGYALDAGLLWRPSALTFVQVSATDLASRLRVDRVSTQQATASSETHQFDSDGYLNYRPLASGRYSASTLVRRLDPKWSLVAGTRLSAADDAIRVGARFERFAGIDMPALWAAAPVGGGYALQVDGDLRFRSIGVGVASRWVSLLVRSQAAPVGRSGVLGWQASIGMPI